MFLQVETGSPSRYDSTASEDYVTAMTTQAIIETIPKEVTQSSDTSDQELKEPLSTDTTPPEALLVPESEPEIQGELSSDLTLVEVKEEEEEEEQEPEDNDCKYLLLNFVYLVPVHPKLFILHSKIIHF